jgi:hypothetical protein
MATEPFGTASITDERITVLVRPSYLIAIGVKPLKRLNADCYSPLLEHKPASVSLRESHASSEPGSLITPNDSSALQFQNSARPPPDFIL